MSDHQSTLAHVRSAYGVQTSDSYEGDIAQLHAMDRIGMYTDEFLAQGGRFTRIRLLAERGFPFMDVSYVYGVLPSGQEVRLNDFGHDARLTPSKYRSQLAAQIKANGGTYAQIQQAWKTENYAILWG